MRVAYSDDRGGRRRPGIAQDLRLAGIAVHSVPNGEITVASKRAEELT